MNYITHIPIYIIKKYKITNAYYVGEIFCLDSKKPISYPELLDIEQKVLKKIKANGKNIS